MELTDKIFEIVYDMENKEFQNHISHKKKKSDSKFDLRSVSLFSSLVISVVILILCSQIDKLHLLIKTFFNSEPQALFYTLLISFLILMGCAMIEASISNTISRKSFSKYYIYNQLNTVYASDVQLLISEMKCDDVDKIYRSKVWFEKLFSKSFIECISIASILTIFDKIIIEEWSTFNFNICYSEVLFVIISGLITLYILCVTAMLCGAMLTIQERTFSNYVIVEEYLLEKWSKSNNMN